MSSHLPSLLVGFAGGAAAGALVALAVRPDPPQVPRPGAVEPGGGHVALDEVVAELRRIREVLEVVRPSTAPDEGRLPVSNASPDLAAALKELTELSRSRVASNPGATEPHGVVSWPNRADREVSPSKRSALWSVPIDEDAFASRHHFSTIQEILSAYGAPDSTYVADNGRWSWRYSTDERAATFTFFQGVVTSSRFQ